MPKGSKSKYTAKQKRQAKHIEESERESGRSSKTAARIGWATVNKQTGGAGKAAKKSNSKKTAPRGRRSQAASGRAA